MLYLMLSSALGLWMLGSAAEVGAGINVFLLIVLGLIGWNRLARRQS
ncbi:MAG: hypothetical protein K0S68_105 [Candidatus Saccharibacteria bacterium]|nr:hypothetical protein [Candidatus Saccharibacteria bacterium]